MLVQLRVRPLSLLLPLATLGWLTFAGLTSAYANDQFGLVESQGCINLMWADGEYLFGLTRLHVADGDNARWAVGELKATPVMIVQ
jgi:hypothetical protein